MIQLGTQNRTKKSDSDSQCCKESDSIQKLPAPQSGWKLSEKVLLAAIYDTVNVLQL